MPPFSHQALKARQPGADVECLCCEQVGSVPGALTMAMKAAGLHRRPAGAQGAQARRAAHTGAGGRRPGPRTGPADGTGRRGGGDGPRDRDRRGREGDDDTPGMCLAAERRLEHCQHVPRRRALAWALLRLPRFPGACASPLSAGSGRRATSSSAMSDELPARREPNVIGVERMPTMRLPEPGAMPPAGATRSS